jgi:hypothetical protein
MKKNLSVFGLFAAILLASNVSSANADPTYAVLDANGNVTNVIVCGSACASGEFGGNKVVLQVASDPVTNENRGSFWNGPGTTTFNENTGAFTVNNSQPVQKNFSETTIEISPALEESTVLSTATITGESTSFSFKYEDTIGSNLFVKDGFIFNYTDNTVASVSVTKDNVVESLDLGTRKTNEQIVQKIQDFNLILLNSKIQTLISLLGSWVK